MTAEDLARAWGADLPSGCEDLDADDLAALAHLLAAAQRRQAEALAGAVEAGMGFLPRLLRGPVTRILLR